MKKTVTIFILLFMQYMLAQAPNDCVNAIVVCGNGIISSNAEGIGNWQEVSGCGGFEHNSIWLKINVVQSGTLGFHIRPTNTDLSVDYDFWVYGPNKPCNNLGSPIRCATTNPLASQAVGTIVSNNHTGMVGTTTATTAGPGELGNSYVRWLTVTAGQSYYIAIDRPEGDGGFELEWIGSATQGSGAFAPPPVANPIPEQKTCSTNPNVGIFDLNSYRGLINSDLVNNSIKYYATLANAVDNISALPNIIANTSNPQQIFAKVTNMTTGCSTIIDFNLRVYPVPNASISASTAQICPGELVTVTITGTPGAIVEYRIGSGAVQNAVLDVNGIFTFEDSPMTISTYSLLNTKIVGTDGATLCSQPLNTAVTVTVNTLQAPTFITNSPICQNETASITFTGTPNATIQFSLNGVVHNVTLSGSGEYVHTEANVVGNIEVILLNTRDTVAPFCSLDLNSASTIVVNTLPVITVPTPLSICSDNPTLGTALFSLDSKIEEIRNNDASLVVTFYISALEAQLGNTANALPLQFESGNRTVYVRVVSAFGCVSFTELELRVLAVPLATVPAPIQVCEMDHSGVGEFDLTLAIPEIIAGNTQPVTVTFYESLLNAQNAQNEILNITARHYPSRSLFVRVDNGNCFEIIEMQLMVNLNPVIPVLNPYVLCDDDFDGERVFDLTSLNNTILDNLNPAIHTVRFYTSENSALNMPLDFIGLPQNYTNETPFIQILWVRLENTLTHCFEVKSFEIKANVGLTLPQNIVLNECDTNNDGFASFNLQQANSLLLVNATSSSNYQVTYYSTLMGAQNADASQLITNTNNFDNPVAVNSTIGVRVMDLITNCVSTTTVQLHTVALPNVEVLNLAPLTRCDVITPNDGQEFFDLSIYENSIRGGIDDLLISYHASVGEANSGSNPIVDYTHYLSGTRTIYVRVINTSIATPQCSVVVPLQLQVNALPVLVLNRLSICDANSSGFAAFDLQANSLQLLGTSQSPSQFTVSFYKNSSTTQLITQNPYTNAVANLEVIYVKIVNNVSGCEIVQPLELKVDAGAMATAPSPLAKCDLEGDNDGVVTFDLTSLNNQVLNGQDPTTFLVTYHLNNSNAVTGVNPILNPESYQNILSPYNQTIFIRVKNTAFTTSCTAVTSVRLTVEPLLEPKIVTDNNANTICVDYETGAVLSNLLLRSSIQGSMYTYTWYLNGAVIPGATASTYLVNRAEPGNYSVLVNNMGTGLGCASSPSDDFEVIQSGPASIIDYTTSSAFASNASINVEVEGYGEYWFQLNDGAIVNNGGLFTDVAPGTYTVTVYDRKTNSPSCDSVSIFNIQIIDYPKFFTPNADGYNDTWNITSLKNQANSKITIFDRYGKLLKSISPAGEGWDGTFNGHALLATDYWFVVTYEEEGMQKEFKSHFSLKR
jgi:gliding motility-associated-like protein